MNLDPAAQAVLDEVVASWRCGGVLGPLRELVATVWETNSHRHETRLGDDALTLGVTSSRNICNLAVGLLAKTPGVVARGGQTLEVSFEGRCLHVGKVPSSSRSWSIESVSWQASDVRIEGAAANSAAYSDAAEANSAAYVSSVDTLFEGRESLSRLPSDPRAMKRLHLSWQGFADGGTRAWLGFPCAEDNRRWFAVTLLDDPEGGGGGRPVDGDHPVAPSDNFDEMAESPLVVVRRERRARGA